MAKFYLTTSIAYVNSVPHVGFALECIQADALARYNKLKGNEVFFLTGTDEHGVKIFDTAKGLNRDPKEYVDEISSRYLDLKSLLNLTNDDFIRTSSDRHKVGAKALWTKLIESGDIYKNFYEGLYCVGCEAFILEKDLDAEGNCPIHKKAPKPIKEENYFFRLSKYSDKIKELIEKDQLLILPKNRKKEMINLIGDGLNDVSFSRPKTSLTWGVDVPDDPDHVMYVWCDALTNYISALGYGTEKTDLFEKYWPCDAHMLGKDILRFHATIWIGMLLSAGVELPKSILVHGYVTSEGQKMSKSLGNVVDPFSYVEKYGADALRYYLLREIPTADDGDFTHSSFVEIFNSELANNLGNLLNRVLMMSERYMNAEVKEITDAGEIYAFLEEKVKKYDELFMGFDYRGAAELVLEILNFANKYIDDKKPWSMAKTGDMKDVQKVLYELIEIVKFAAVLLVPFIPQSAYSILNQLSVEEKNVSFDLLKWGTVKSGTKLKREEKVLFPRLEE